MAVTTFDMTKFVIDRAIRGVMVSPTDDVVQWMIDQVTNPSLSCSTETQDAVDMLGTPVATFDRAKTVEFSGENAFFDLGLYAAQAGTKKEVATSDNKIVAPYFDTIIVENPNDQIQLKFTPTAQIKEIHLLKNDSTFGTRFTNGGEANETTFVHTDGSNKITLPTSGIKKGDVIFVRYNHETEKAVSVSNNAQSFPTAGKFILQVLVYNVCDQETKRNAYLIMDNAKLTGDYDLTFSTESTHPFSIKCNQAYCTKDRTLVRLVIPDEE